MSRPAQLPPRCRLQNRGPLNHDVDSSSLTILRDDEVQVQHRRFPSHGSLFEKQPSWIVDLLGDLEMSSKEVFHRRSASDSVTILELPSNFQSTTSHADNEIPSDGTSLKTPEVACKTEACSGLEEGCMYGPNSPRKRANLTHAESSIVSAVLENVPHNPFQYVSLNQHCGSELSQSNVKVDNYAATGDPDLERTSRRHSGQRSRVRKLQYIAELERTVNVFQTLIAELAAKVAPLFQQRAVLSVENSTLKQQIVSLRKEKMIKDGQYQYLKNEEAKELKTIFDCQQKGKSISCFQMVSRQKDTLETSWQLLDMGKLSLGGSPVPMQNGFRS